MAATPSGSKPPIPGFLVVSPTTKVEGNKKFYDATRTPEDWQPPAKQYNAGIKKWLRWDSFIMSDQEAMDPNHLGPKLGGSKQKIAEHLQMYGPTKEQSGSGEAVKSNPQSVNDASSKPPSITGQPTTEPIAVQKTQLSAAAEAFSAEGRAETVGFIDTLVRAVNKGQPFEAAAKKDKKNQSLFNRLYGSSKDRRTVRKATAAAPHTQQEAIDALEREKTNLPNRRRAQSFDSVRDRSLGIFESVVPEAKKASRGFMSRLRKG